MAKEIYRQEIEKCGNNVVKRLYDVFTGKLIRIIVNDKIICDCKKCTLFLLTNKKLMILMYL